MQDSSTEARRLRRVLDCAEAERAAALEEAARVQREAVFRSCPDCFRRVEEAIKVYRRELPPNMTPRQFDEWVASNILEIARFVDQHDRGVA
ncbi:hypothetical protein [Nannocystis pusilla]|uniref:hypothetical protein n=1 Tax=Nannocystis pusilla TaxID=889268 RepID=UPI003B7DE8FC